MIKIGRRGSLSGRLALSGRQGHVAYPHLADNPMRRLAGVLDAPSTSRRSMRAGGVPAVHLEVTTVDTGNSATNVIPARVEIAFNVRFNDRWTPETFAHRARAADRSGARRRGLRHRLARAGFGRLRDGRRAPDGALSQAVEAVTGRSPALSTSGARRMPVSSRTIAPWEFGLVGATMHMANERVALSDLETLTAIYETFIARWFAAQS